MVDIAQLVSASDCGSEGRGFESHYPPHKKYRGLCLGIFYGMDMGFERPATAKPGQKQSGGLFLGRGKVHAHPNAPEGVWTDVHYLLQ